MINHDNEGETEMALALKRAGFPSFEEFKRDPEKYRRSKDKWLAMIDRSVNNPATRQLIEKQTYKLRGFSFDSLEKLERAAREEGVDIMKCKVMPQIIPQLAGKISILVTFVPPGEKYVAPIGEKEAIEASRRFDV
jgi:hypothetical protein